MDWSALQKRALWLLPVLPVALVLYYGIGMGIAHIIDDDADAQPRVVEPSQSRAVAMAAQLILREVDENKWVANDPIFKPSALLDDMAAYQTGIVAAIARFTDRLAGLSLDNGERDVELGRAAGLLKYPGSIWKFDLKSAWMPTASSEKQYRLAARNLEGFNERLADGNSQYPRDAATLAALLNGIGADMDAVIARFDQHMEQPGWALLDTQADDLFYDAKGRAYAQSLVLRELGWDFAAVIAQHNLGDDWQTMLTALRQAAAQRPLWVMAAGEDSALFANHLANHGFRLLQARAKLAALSNALNTKEH
ncbi:MAG: DUF2333 family protein [Magnetospirillum gryphiswaldense]|nr:DUF2333 family protein [Magnetospirillum gryphiswaldense]